MANCLSIRLPSLLFCCARCVVGRMHSLMDLPHDARALFVFRAKAK